MPLSQDDIERIVREVVESSMTDEMRTNKVMREHGFRRSPRGTKAILPSEIMRDYEARKQADSNRRNQALGLDPDEQ